MRGTTVGTERQLASKAQKSSCGATGDFIQVMEGGTLRLWTEYVRMVNFANNLWTHNAHLQLTSTSSLVSQAPPVGFQIDHIPSVLALHAAIADQLAGHSTSLAKETGRPVPPETNHAHNLCKTCDCMAVKITCQLGQSNCCIGFLFVRSLLVCV